MRDRVKRGILSLAVVLGCFALLPPLAAEPVEAQKSRIFKRLDANNDGVITKEEVRAAFRKRFEKFDANSDGVVTLDEVERMADERFKRFDLNGDGQATKEEIAEAKRLRDKE